MRDQKTAVDEPLKQVPETPKVPRLPCLRCDELDTRQQTAQAAHDRSALVDFRVLMREHARLARCPRARDVVAAFT
ncbi:hypothetical protein GCM10010442_34890 [Kitasatospora kifunensis]|uniref:Uncharacterized protein n=1 Tax=Kitasatospora kifunensis TaxID=58351 RepID=A0A7W7RA78_KITKI|nr:hypothetical protein [Kitasatospora kifunensis]